MDERMYETILMDDGNEWLVKNLAVTKDNNGNELILGKDYFYPNNDVNNVRIFGLLYTWDAAMRIVPDGWHLPTQKEWRKLKESLKLWDDKYSESAFITHFDEWGKLEESLAMGGYSESKVLAYTDYWKDYSQYWAPCPGKDMKTNNFSGFSAVPAGYCDIEDEIVTFQRYEEHASFWSSTTDENFIDYALHFFIGYNGQFVGTRGIANKTSGLSVRCIRDL